MDQLSDRAQTDAGLAVCTVATLDRYPQVCALAASVRRHHPSASVFVLWAEPANAIDPIPNGPFTNVFLEEIGVPEMLEDMAYYYEPLEFCCALKPWILLHCLEELEVQGVCFYCDADIWVLAHWGPILSSSGSAPILLCPHMLSVVEDTGSWNQWVVQMELGHLAHGVFNSGFVGVRRSDEAARFLRWWRDRCRLHALGQPPTFYDQQWLMFLPNLFEGVHTIRHPGAGCAWYNLFERQVEEVAGKVTVNGHPLLFWHFSGWSRVQGQGTRAGSGPSSLDPRPLSEHGITPPDAEVPPAVSALARRYREELASFQDEKYLRRIHGFATHNDGTPITHQQRRRHRDEVLRRESLLHHRSPFGGARP